MRKLLGLGIALALSAPCGAGLINCMEASMPEVIQLYLAIAPCLDAEGKLEMLELIEAGLMGDVECCDRDPNCPAVLGGQASPLGTIKFHDCPGLIAGTRDKWVILEETVHRRQWERQLPEYPWTKFDDTIEWSQWFFFQVIFNGHTPTAQDQSEIDASISMMGRLTIAAACVNEVEAKIKILKQIKMSDLTCDEIEAMTIGNLNFWDQQLCFYLNLGTQKVDSVSNDLASMTDPFSGWNPAGDGITELAGKLSVSLMNLSIEKEICRQWILAGCP